MKRRKSSSEFGTLVQGTVEGAVSHADSATSSWAEEGELLSLLEWATRCNCLRSSCHLLRVAPATRGLLSCCVSGSLRRHRCQECLPTKTVCLDDFLLGFFDHVPLDPEGPRDAAGRRPLTVQPQYPPPVVIHHDETTSWMVRCWFLRTPPCYCSYPVAVDKGARNCGWGVAVSWCGIQESFILLGPRWIKPLAATIW